jgi:hypothetical protein
MTKQTALPTIAIAAASLLLVTGCGKKENASPSGSASSPASSSSSSSGKSDYSKPALTEEKLTRFIDSMQEEKNPLEFIFKPGGGMRGMMDMKAKEVELNAYARKYGFKDYVEYIDTWGRVMVGQMQIGAAKMFQGLRESSQKSMEEAEAKLKDPSLTAEQRRLYTEQVESSKKSLADMAKADTNSLNAADVTLVEKFSDRINAAAKKHRGQ